MPIDTKNFWRDAADGTSVSSAEISAWESQHGVTLPRQIRELLLIRNGGYVSRSDLEILSLADIRPLEEEQREWIGWDLADEIEDYNPDRVFVFCYEHLLGGAYFLDYNRHGPQHEPLVLEYFSDPGDARFEASSVTEFLEDRLARSTEPLVNWQETEDVQVIAQESIDLSRLWGSPARLDQILGLLNGQMVLFQREETRDGLRLSKIVLPQPFDPDWARIAPYRPKPIATHALHLQPHDSDGIIEEESTQEENGLWKNSRGEGAPIYVLFESTDALQLRRLKQQIFSVRH